MLRRLIGTFFLLFLTACQAPTLEPFAVMDFRQETPVSVPVQSIETVDQTVRYTDLPHLETRIPVVPAYALKQALDNRFRATRPLSDITIVFTIQEASLTQKMQESDSWYILDNAEYLLEYQVEAAYYKKGDEVQKQNFSGWEKQALPRRSSLAEKEEAWQKMINAMIQKLTRKIQTDMPPDLKP